MSHFYSRRPEIPRLSGLPANEDRSTQKSQSAELPRYKVILLHDAFDDLMFVVRSVMELTHFPRAEATHKMWEAHHSGQSVLLVTYRERAEWLVEQFAGKGLKATIELMPD
jgi:ATP-dependent Clp protease adapter protein ClpS